MKILSNKYFIATIIPILLFGILAFLPSTFWKSTYELAYNVVIQAKPVLVATTSQPVITHIKTPEPLKAIYMTACIAGSKKLRKNLIDLVKETELNSLIIDIKDFTGTISFKTDNPEFADSLQKTCPVSDMPELIKELHESGIYVIGRITVFQDLSMAKRHPELAVKTNSNRSVVWRDRKGMAYIDPGAEEHWKSTVSLAEESYKIGFDELNFDYIRFPSDGNMADIYFPYSEEIVKADKKMGKARVVKSFFEYLHEQLSVKNIPTSGDLFGMTTTNTDDLNIGQILEYATDNFDFVAPMVYPSHYPSGFNGWADVNAHPYDIVKFSMDKAVERMKVATTSPLKLRPWLQDNDYPVHYTAEMVRAQIKATYDSGLTSWMLWDAANTYTRGALLPE